MLPEKRAKRIEKLIAAPEFPARLEQAVTVMLLERRAGGKISDVNGCDAIGGSGAIAACPELHPKVVVVLDELAAGSLARRDYYAHVEHCQRLLEQRQFEALGLELD